MGEKYLTLLQNLCAARVFLNTFGLTLEDVSEVCAYSKIKIFDKDINEVGDLCFNDGKVIMRANYNNSLLDASYDIAKMTGFVDPECESAPFALFGEWNSKILFQVQKSDNITLSGEFLITCSVDTEFGVTCLCHPLINIEVPKKGNIFLKILRNGSMFNLEIVSGENSEVIDIRPWNVLNGFILHDIKKGKYDKEIGAYPYRKYAGIFNAGEVGENKDKLHVYLSEEENNQRLDFINGFPIKLGSDRKLLLQKGKLMQEIDPDMFEKIKKLREILLIGDVSLLDNIVSVCYDSYTDEELNVLLGVNREKMNYQNGGDNLVNSYYGIGINNNFFPLENQKKLLEKN